MSTPPKPEVIAADVAPPGVEYKHVLFSRPKLKSPARLILIHTNAANGEGSIESAWNWSHRAPNQNTCPTYQVDRSGRARKMLASDEDSIANCTTADAEDGHGDVSEWSLSIETADTGTLDDPTISAFTPAQVETISLIVAYESVLWNIPIVTPTVWHGTGVAGHTDPFGYPYWTCYSGKICPGSKKKAQIRNEIMPRAREIAAAWLNPPEEPVTLDQQDIDAIANAVLAKLLVSADTHLGWKLAGQVWKTTLANESASILLARAANKTMPAAVTADMVVDELVDRLAD